MNFLRVSFMLILSHYSADYAQTGFTARFKAPGSAPGWIHVLLGHTSIQAVCALSVLSWLGYSKPRAMGVAAVEMVLHTLIDIAKCKGVISMNQDQALHIVCKFIYSVFLTRR